MEIPKNYKAIDVTSKYYGSHDERDGDDVQTYYCRPEDVEAMRSFQLSHGSFSANTEEVSKFYQFCLAHDVLDEDGTPASDVHNFYIVGFGYPSEINW